MAKQEYIEKNRRWLQEKATESGVKALDKGIYYKVLRSGAPGGAQPGRSSVVTVHYTGRTINGKTFDSSRAGFPPARANSGVDYRPAADARGRPLGDIHSRRTGLWPFQPAGYSRRFDAGVRYRAARRGLSMAGGPCPCTVRCQFLIPADAWGGSVYYLRKISNLAAPETPAPLIPLSILILFNPF